MTRPIALLLGGVVVVAACSSSAKHSQPPATAAPATNVATTLAPHEASTSAPAPVGQAVRWSTYYGAESRSGSASDGPASPATVHKLWSAAVDGLIYAQPLIVGNRVVVATENNSVYVLNAANGSVVWHTRVGNPVPNSALPCGDVDPVGITGTPVVDVRANRVYAAALVRQPLRTMLFALDLTTGRILASTGVDAPGSDPAAQNQRSALTFVNGFVYVPFGGRFGDCGTYHGRVVAVKTTARGFGAVTSYTLPTQGQGGFWTPPGAATASDGSLFLASGNSASSGGYDYGNSVVRLSSSLRLLDAWAPADWKALNGRDGDIGSTSPVLLPGNLVFQVGKNGVGYLLDANHLGGIGGEVHSAEVCRGSSAYGGVARVGNILFVPCSDGVVEVNVQGHAFSTGWKASIDTPGPTIVANGAVWAVATGSGALIAINASTGAQLTSQSIGSVPSRFTSAAAGGRRVVVGAGGVVEAFGN
jgi:outer membrane protein assembly factor BamB